MPFTSQNPLLGSFGTPVTNVSNLSGNTVSPQEWEYIQQVRRTGYDQTQTQTQQVNNQSDPYSDFEVEFSKCSSLVQNRVLNDKTFQQSMLECDKLIQATVERIVRPQVLQTKEGRIAFENLLATFRNLKDGYAHEEAQNMEKLQMLMQDDVVKQRLAELENKSAVSSNDAVQAHVAQTKEVVSK